MEIDGERFEPFRQNEMVDVEYEGNFMEEIESLVMSTDSKNKDFLTLNNPK